MSNVENALSGDPKDPIFTELEKDSEGRFPEEIQEKIETLTHEMDELLRADLPSVIAGLREGILIKDRVTQLKMVSSSLKDVWYERLQMYHEELNTVQQSRDNIQMHKEKIEELTQNLVEIQRLQNIHEQIRRGNYWAAYRRAKDQIATTSSAMMEGWIAERELVEMFLDKAVDMWIDDVGKDSVESGRRFLAEAVPLDLDCSLLFQAYCIKNDLGSFEEWRDWYKQKRLAQLQDIVRYVEKETAHDIFCRLAGWILVEKQITLRVFSLIPDWKIQWDSTLGKVGGKLEGKAKMPVDLSKKRNQVKELLGETKSFLTSMDQIGCECDGLARVRETIVQGYIPYVTKGRDVGAKMFTDIIKEKTYEFMAINNEECYQKCLQYGLVDQNFKWPGEVNFSESLLRSYESMDDFLRDFRKDVVYIDETQFPLVCEWVEEQCADQYLDQGKQRETPKDCAFCLANLYAMQTSIEQFNNKWKAGRLANVHTHLSSYIKTLQERIVDLIFGSIAQFIGHDFFSKEKVSWGGKGYRQMDDVQLFLDAHHASIAPVVPQFTGVIYESIAERLSEHFGKIIIGDKALRWTPRVIQNVKMDLESLLGSGCFHQIKTNGLSNMVQLMTLLLNPSLGTIGSDVQFSATYPDIPWDILLVILKNYVGKADAEGGLFVMPPTLVTTLKSYVETTIKKSR